jgi:AraC family transcriptional regulator
MPTPNAATLEDHRARMRKVLRYLEERLDEPIELDELAGVAAYSPHHFHRIFTGMVGESVKSHTRRLKLERAAWRLRFQSGRVTDIGLDAGYESLEAFSRAFRAAFGVSPTRCRAEARRAGASKDKESWPRHEFHPLQGAPDMQPEIKRIDPFYVASVRHVGPYSECEKAWGALCAWAGPLGLLGPRTRFLGLCHDDPEITPPDKIRYDACCTLPDSAAVQRARDSATGDALVRELPGQECACVVHKGAFSGLAATYAWLCGVWIPEQGREIATAPSLEIYLNDPKTTPPDELLTEVLVPLI